MDIHPSLLTSYLRDVLDNTVQYKRLVGCHPPHTQKILDSFQSLLDIPHLDWDFLRKLIVATQRISATSGLYPRCYDLKGVEQIGPQVEGGTFSDIFKGKFQGRHVCIRAVRLFGVDADVRKRILKKFSKEVILWGQLSHPNILPVFGLFHSTSLGRFCFVSPWMEYGNLKRYLDQQPDAPRLLLALDVSKGLQYLHWVGVVHGDLKGANVLIDGDGRACLADFGFSSIIDLNLHIPAWTSQSLVASKGGTDRWKAPELLDPKGDDDIENTFQSDIYALACVFYEIFTGHVPLEGVTNKRQIPRKIWKGTRPTCPDRLSPSWNRGLNQNIWSLMTRCWHKRPDKRPSLAQIIHILESTAPGDTRPLDAGSSSDLAPSAFRRRMSEGSNFIDLETLKDIVGPRELNPRETEQRNYPRSLSLSGIVGPYKLNPRATEQGNDPSSLSLSVQRLTMSENFDPNTRQTLVIRVKNIFTQSNLPQIPLYIKRIDQINDRPQAGGGSGDIYKGVYQERVVCLKTVRGTHSTTNAKVIAREVFLWGQMSHQNILPFYGLYPYNGGLSMVSPWASNGTVVDFVRKNPATNRPLLCSDIASGIEYLHSNGIVHGDLKSPNILVDKSGRAYLGDFGLAGFAEPTRIAWHSHSHGGTIRWQAPELIKGAPEDCLTRPPNTKSTDIYAFSCVFAELFTGLIPFPSDTNTMVVSRVLKGERPALPSPSEGRQMGFTDEFRRLVQDCWHENPLDRPSIEQVKFRLAPHLPDDDRAVGEWQNQPPPLEMNTGLGTLSPGKLEKILERKLCPQENRWHKLFLKYLTNPTAAHSDWPIH